MIQNVDNAEKHGNNLEVTLKDVDDMVSMFVNGYEVVVEYCDNGLNINVYDDTNPKIILVTGKFYGFKNLAGKAEEA